MWESTGLYGESSLRRYQLGAEQPQKHVPLLPQLFGEGICRVGGSIWQLTWRERIALRWDAATMKLLEMVPFDRDGWGICSSGGYVLTSDGGSELVLRNPGTLQPLSSMPVHCNGYPVSAINDLTYVGGRIWANLHCRHYVIGIDSHTGEITDIVDARAVMERPSGDHTQAILNGIATFPSAGELLLSGKGWRYIYHVRLVEGRPSKHPEKLIVDLLYNNRSSSSGLHGSGLAGSARRHYSSRAELEIALAQILHPRPVGITGIPIRTRLKRSRPGAIVDTTEISDSGGVSSQA